MCVSCFTKQTSAALAPLSLPALFPFGARTSTDPPVKITFCSGYPGRRLPRKTALRDVVKTCSIFVVVPQRFRDAAVHSAKMFINEYTFVEPTPSNHHNNIGNDHNNFVLKTEPYGDGGTTTYNGNVWISGNLPVRLRPYVASANFFCPGKKLRSMVAIFQSIELKKTIIIITRFCAFAPRYYNRIGQNDGNFLKKDSYRVFLKTTRQTRVYKGGNHFIFFFG